MSEQRFPMILLGAFAGLALLLAAVGIYGTISYYVAQCGKDIGIRMALGADQGTVLRQFIGEELRLVLGGIALGTVGVIGLARSLSSLSRLLYGVGLGDPVTFATASAVLIVVAAFAGYIPARRAAKVDPMVAIRYE